MNRSSVFGGRPFGARLTFAKWFWCDTFGCLNGAVLKREASIVWREYRVAVITCRGVPCRCYARLLCVSEVGFSRGKYTSGNFIAEPSALLRDKFG